jgi:hypothetical protein
VFHPNTIQALLGGRPFVPFRIVTSSGQSYDIRHPELVLVGARFLAIGAPANENPGRYEARNLVAIMHVTDLQNLPPHNL